VIARDSINLSFSKHVVYMPKEPSLVICLRNHPEVWYNKSETACPVCLGVENTSKIIADINELCKIGRKGGAIALVELFIKTRLI
jgi:hypothetical protein